MLELETTAIEDRRAELERLLYQRYLLSKKINKLRNEIGLPKEEEYPHHKCKRCAYEWLGRVRHRKPTTCPRCHSNLWFEEPLYPNRPWKPGRRPNDAPNPNWATRWGRKKPYTPPAITELPPPPKLTSVAALPHAGYEPQPETLSRPEVNHEPESAVRHDRQPELPAEQIRSEPLAEPLEESVPAVGEDGGSDETT